jgi:hypothetical protein
MLALAARDLGPKEWRVKRRSGSFCELYQHFFIHCLQRHRGEVPTGAVMALSKLKTLIGIRIWPSLFLEGNV